LVAFSLNIISGNSNGYFKPTEIGYFNAAEIGVFNPTVMG
jgi:hypothetical protein